MKDIIKKIGQGRPEDKTRLLLVEWEDAAFCSGWHSIPEARKWYDEDRLVISMGFEIANDKEHLMLAHTLGPVQVGDMLRIPKGIVRTIKVLGEI